MKNNFSIFGDMFEWEDSNPNNEDRTGHSVMLVEDRKIRSATASDLRNKIFGVIGPDDENTMFVANTWEQEWHNKHMRDKFGRELIESQTLVTWIVDGRREIHEADRHPADLVIPPDAEYWTSMPGNPGPLFRPVLSERYNDGTQGQGNYQGRLKRKEWAVVVILGEVELHEEFPANSSWIEIQKNRYYIR
jgi:hypothetical protein